mmetsp:Transcript_22535/g.73917  ORF Transcript_22535/g.73917 Transcript_22535/m.73917 type:complete len:204 (+) Transcript_22535:1051-1662(+)
MHVLVQHRRHLQLLDGRHAPLREEDEAFHILLPPQPVDRRAPSVSGRRSHYRDPLVRPRQEVLKEVSQGLQSHVLERERGPMEQLHDMHISYFLGRDNVLVLEVRIAPFHQVSEVSFRDLVSHIRLGDLVCELVEGQVLPLLVLVANIWNEVRDQKSSVLSQPFEHGLLEAHVEESSSCAAKQHLFLLEVLVCGSALSGKMTS